MTLLRSTKYLVLAFLMIVCLHARAEDPHLGPVTDLDHRGDRVFSVSQGGLYESHGRNLKRLFRPEFRLTSLAVVGERILVGFAAETENVRDYAASKLRRKNLDLIVANDVSRPESGFDVCENAAWLIDSEGEETESGLVAKDTLAELVLDRVMQLLAERRRAALGA